MRFVASGKVKDLYDLGDDRLLFRFTDRVSAYDVRFAQDIPEKGRVLCRFAEYWFETLQVENHFIERRSETEIIVRRMEMVPMECVVRGYFYGSLAHRWEENRGIVPDGTDARLAARLPGPVFDPTTKSEHDAPVDRRGAVDTGLVTEQEFDLLRGESIRIYDAMSRIADRAGFILADLKLEFGRLDGRLVLGDSIGPDECRLWPKETYAVGRIQEAYDKQILRDWLAANGYRKEFDDARARGEPPVPPRIPGEIAEKMTARYVAAYERITGRRI